MANAGNPETARQRDTLRNFLMNTVLYYSSELSLEENLEEQIVRARRASMDRSIVSYDITTGIDFSKPRKTGETLAKVLFEQDISK